MKRLNSIQSLIYRLEQIPGALEGNPQSELISPGLADRSRTHGLRVRSTAL